jgi:hypothetical protein
MMAQASTPGSGLSRPSADNDVYTALIVVAFLFVLTATIYVGYRAQTLFDTLLPPGGS